MQCKIQYSKNVCFHQNQVIFYNNVSETLRLINNFVSFRTKVHELNDSKLRMFSNAERKMGGFAKTETRQTQ
jgi:hypothetical protein